MKLKKNFEMKYGSLSEQTTYSKCCKTRESNDDDSARNFFWCMVMVYLLSFPTKKARMFCNIGVNIHKILSYIQKYNKIRRPKSEMRGIKLSLIHVCKTAPVNTGKCKHMTIYKCLKIEPSLIFMVWGMVGYDTTPLQRSTVG